MIEHLKNLIIGLIMIVSALGAVMTVGLLIAYASTSPVAGWILIGGTLLVVSYLTGKYWRES